MCFLCRCCCQEVRGLNPPSGSGFSPLRAFLTKCETFCSGFFFFPPPSPQTCSPLDFWTTFQTKHTNKPELNLGLLTFVWSFIICAVAPVQRPTSTLTMCFTFSCLYGHLLLDTDLLLLKRPMAPCFSDLKWNFLWKFLQQTADYLWQGIILLLSAMYIKDGTVSFSFLIFFFKYTS